MLAPTRGAQTSETQLELFWQALTGIATGGAAIDSYNLKYDQGSSTWADVIGQDGNF